MPSDKKPLLPSKFYGRHRPWRRARGQRRRCAGAGGAAQQVGALCDHVPQTHAAVLFVCCVCCARWACVVIWRRFMPANTQITHAANHTYTQIHGHTRSAHTWCPVQYSVPYCAPPSARSAFAGRPPSASQRQLAPLPPPSAAAAAAASPRAADDLRPAAQVRRLVMQAPWVVCAAR